MKRFPGDHADASARLSVSSNGSTWVKPMLQGTGISVFYAFSILERIDVGETRTVADADPRGSILSVSSNGSTWVKLGVLPPPGAQDPVLSVSSNGSTWVKQRRCCVWSSTAGSFSILERIDVGETIPRYALRTRLQSTFSILERIDVGETRAGPPLHSRAVPFQYPRTDRRG